MDQNDSGYLGNLGDLRAQQSANTRFAVKGACDVSTPDTPAGWGRIHFTREDGVGTFSIDRHLSATDAASLEAMIRSFLVKGDERERAEKEAMFRKARDMQKDAMKKAIAAAGNHTGL